VDVTKAWPERVRRPEPVVGSVPVPLGRFSPESIGRVSVASSTVPLSCSSLLSSARSDEGSLLRRRLVLVLPIVWFCRGAIVDGSPL
jgi:hypothetical protein